MYPKFQLMKNLGIKMSLLISCGIAVYLTIMPLPDYLKFLMPNWLLLVLIYWKMVTTNIMDLYFVFWLGIVFDLLLDNCVGSTSLCLLPVIFLASGLHYRLKNFSNLKQLLVILGLIILYQFLRLWIQLYLKHISVMNLNYWLSVFTNIIVWPIISSGLNILRKSFKFC